MQISCFVHFKIKCIKFELKCAHFTEIKFWASSSSKVFLPKDQKPALQNTVLHHRDTLDFVTGSLPVKVQCISMSYTHFRNKRLHNTDMVVCSSSTPIAMTDTRGGNVAQNDVGNLKPRNLTLCDHVSRSH